MSLVYVNVGRDKEATKVAKRKAEMHVDVIWGAADWGQAGFCALVCLRRRGMRNVLLGVCLATCNVTTPPHAPHSLTPRTLHHSTGITTPQQRAAPAQPQRSKRSRSR
jgi:hypothetical protein